MKISDIFIIVKICEVSVKMTKAINSAVMREKNEKLILSLINKDAKSRTEIAKRIGLTKSAMTKIMDDLIQRGIVTEQIEKSNTIGRSPVMLFLNEKAFYVVGINITRRRITVGITDLGGNIVAQDEFPICSPDIALVKIKETIDAQIEMSGIDASKIFKASVITPSCGYPPLLSCPKCRIQYLPYPIYPPDSGHNIRYLHCIRPWNPLP